MKPIHLTITAFGAYPDTVEVDFAALAPRGLFLVSGETGTGKTTIFDAMCWALYGAMPSKQPHEVRSDHVDDATRCEVTFTFESAGARYTVSRNPEQLRPAARNPERNVKESAAATLVRVDGDGAQTELIADKVSEVARACQEIIGLDATQFQRVILLPQGEFDQFLVAGTGGREEILERLFGGEIYDRIVEELKATRDATANDLGGAESAIAEKLDVARSHVAEADRALAAVPERTGPGAPIGAVGAARGAGPGAQDAPDVECDEGSDAEPLDRQALTAAKVRLTATLSSCRAELESAAQRRARAQTAHHAASTGAHRFDRAGALRAELVALEGRREQIESDQLAAGVSEQARPIVVAADDLAAAERLHGEAVAARDQRREMIVEALTALEAPTDDLTPVALHRRVSDLRTEHEAANQKLEGRRVADELLDAATKARDDLVARLETAEADRTAAATRTAEIDAQLPDLRAAAVDPGALRAAIDTAARLVEDRTVLDGLEVESVPLSERRAAAAKEHRDLLQAFTDTQAPRLAQTLEDGEACPVCGSTDHPAPATAGELRVVDWDEVAEAAKRHAEADERLRTLETRITELRARLGDDVATDATALRQRVEVTKAELDRATAAAASIGALEKERTNLSSDLDRLTNEAGKLEASRDQAVATLGQAIEAARTAGEEAAGIDAEVLDRRARHLEQLDAALDGYDGLIDAVAHAATLLETRRADLAKHLGDSEHADATAARAVLWTREQEQAAHAAARAHQTAHDTATGALAVLLDEGVPEERPDVDATEAALATADTDKNRLESLVATVDVEVRGLTTALEHCARLDATSAELRARAEVAARAHRVCSKGGPSLPVPLKRWVLAHELDRITAAANVHLAAMTNGRYALRRLEDQHDGRRSFGLDLEVDDTDTGRPRSTRSLSGGEQFQASLALALGLADVISHGGTAGGQAFEALFVDEGFGSLSARALDDAVETLTGLQHSGRMVGAITHVEAMKDALHVGIEVTRRDDGRGSTLTVNY